ncbi:MAG: hypothetical protein WCC08_22125 [Terrimicrobiaceae bacterium]|jgi:hypothetical protein
MAKKNISLTEQEIQMIERLRGRPALSKRFEAILDLSESEQGAVKTADEIEALLIEEIRRLGHTTMEQWAVGAEKRIGKEYKESHPGSYCAKKKG